MSHTGAETDAYEGQACLLYVSRGWMVRCSGLQRVKNGALHDSCYQVVPSVSANTPLLGEGPVLVPIPRRCIAG